MKNIKSNKDYGRIDGDEYNSLLYVKRDGHLYPDNYVNLTKSEADKINHYLNNDLSDYSISDYGVEFSIYNYNIDDAILIIIDKVEDEYFLAVVQHQTNLYYKCDQIEGLLTFIQNVKKACLRHKNWNETV